MRLLEDQLGVSLFHRAHRSVGLIDIGRDYATEVIAAFGRIDAATKNAATSGGSTALTIDSTPSIATQWLMRRLPAYGELHPEIDLKVAVLGKSDRPGRELSTSISGTIRVLPRLGLSWCRSPRT